MPIIVSNEEGTRKINESKFKAESKLQEYIYDSPEVLPIEEIEDDIPFIIAAREVPTNSGPIDAVGLDKNGNIYVIETKLYRNSDKRKVMAQVMDYGAALWKHTDDFSEFIMDLRNRYRDKFDEELDDELISLFDIDEEDMDEYLDDVKQNLDDGKFRFVILMDHVSSRLKDLILFMNQNSMFDVYAVELEHYKFDGYKLTIPRIYGVEVKKSVGTGSRSNRRWTEKSFFEDLKKKIDESDYTKLKKIYEATKELGEVSYGVGANTGSLTLKVQSKDEQKVPVYRFWSNGSSIFIMDSSIDEEMQNKIKNEYASPLKEENLDLPPFEDGRWRGDISDVKGDQVDDFIQFYHDIVEEIRNIQIDENK
ncbi:MAG: hypothetical protein ACOC85_05375 [Thermoplasmatota archaeon]